MNPQKNTKNSETISTSNSGIDDFLTSFEFSDWIDEIILKYKLLDKYDAKRKVEESNRWKLVKLFSKSLTGEQDLDNLDKSIIKELSLDINQSEALIKEMDQMLLLRFGTTLNKIYDQRSKKTFPIIKPTSPNLPKKNSPLEGKDDVYRESIE